MPKRLLFLCSGNFYRSRFAEAVFNAQASRAGLDWQAESRGFRLSPKNVGPISAHALGALQGRKILLAEPIRLPLVATEQDFAQSDLVVAVKEAEHRPMMQARFPQWVDAIEYWQIHDIDFAEPHEALPHLEQHVLSLVTRLQSAANSPAC